VQCVRISSATDSSSARYLQSSADSTSSKSSPVIRACVHKDIFIICLLRCI